MCCAHNLIWKNVCTIVCAIEIVKWKRNTKNMLWHEFLYKSIYTNVW